MGSESFHMKSGSPYFCSKSNETAALMATHTYPEGVETFPYVKTFFCSESSGNFVTNVVTSSTTIIIGLQKGGQLGFK